MQVVFVGPSLDPETVRRVLPAARIEPPIGRGDLDRLRAEGMRDFLLIDGVFAQQLAIAPSEIVAVLRSGARVRGAASLGAIRAAECRPAGMEGLGAVYTLYRWRVISSDDEVAVAVDPERAFAALSVALINVRYAMLATLRRGLLQREQARALLTAAKQAHFSQRSWSTIFEAAGVPFAGAVRAICERTDVKRRDAISAVQRLTRDRPISADPAPRPVRTPRTRGHDPHLGHPVETLRSELTLWLLGSGRHRRYGGSADLWRELERCGALGPELMRWHAVTRWGSLAGEHLDSSFLDEARRTVAREHGYEDVGSVDRAEQAWRALARARQAAAQAAPTKLVPGVSRHEEARDQ